MSTQYSTPFTASPETVALDRKQVQEDHIPSLPTRQVDAGNFLAVASTTATIPSANTLTTIKASAGRLISILVTATGTGGPVSIYDNASAASGTVIGVVPANAAAGTIYDLNMPAKNGITVGVGPTSSPAFTLSYS